MRIFFFFISLFLTFDVSAQIRINEFTIEPEQSAEIINIGSASADISGWVIDDSGGTTFYTIPGGSDLLPNSCLAFSGSFNLNKSSADTVRLLNGSILVDSFSYQISPGQNVSFSRVPDGSESWATGAASLGNFNSTQQQCGVVSSPTPTPTPAVTIASSPTTIPSYDNVFISEAMVNPPSGEKEWIEIYNANDFEVRLIDWYIDDVENAGGQPFKLNLTIPPKSYKAFELTTSLLNNSQDFVRLLDVDKIEKDGFEYLLSEKGLTWGRIDFDSKDFCLQEPSKETVNNPCFIEEEDESALDEKSTAGITSDSSKESTIRPVSYQSQTRTGSPNPSNQGTVLGETTVNRAGQKNPLVRLLASLSLSYSSLTIVSILLRIKFNV